MHLQLNLSKNAHTKKQLTVLKGLKIKIPITLIQYSMFKINSQIS